MSQTPHNPHLPTSRAPGANFRKRQKNDLYSAIVEHDADPQTFTLEGPRWVKPNSYLQRLIRHQVVLVVKACTIPSRFVIGLEEPLADVDDGPYAVAYYPHPTMEHEAEFSLDWTGVLRDFHTWLRAIEMESQPDRWEELRRARQIEDAQWEVVESFDSPFTADEILRIGDSLDAAADEIQQKRLLSPEDLKALAAGLQTMKDAAPTTGRINWTNKLLEWWGKWAIDSALKSQAAQQAFDVISEKLSWLAHTLATAGTHVAGFLRG